MPPGECFGGVFFKDSGLFYHGDIVLAINISVKHSFKRIIGFKVADFSLVALLSKLSWSQLMMTVI